MSNYEMLRLVFIGMGLFAGTVLTALIAWVVRVERALAVIRTCDDKYEHNVPDIWRQIDCVKDKLGSIEKRVSVELRKANDPSAWTEDRKAR